MTPSELKKQIEKTGGERYFFTHATMKFFGDTMKNYGVRSTEMNGRPVWELWRKRPVKQGLSESAYFCKRTFKRIFKMGGELK